MRDKLRTIFWPLRSILPPGKTFREKIANLIKRELTANTTPLAVARSLAIGVFIGLTPFYGFQTASMLVLSLLIPVNRPIAILGSCISIAPLMPLIFLMAIFTGKFMLAGLGVPVHAMVVNQVFAGSIEWFVGSWILAVVGGIVTFFVSFYVLKKWKKA